MKSTYDACLLYRNDLLSSFSTKSFEIVEMQIDDTLILVNQTFVDLEEKELKESELMHKKRDHLTLEHSIRFNDMIIDLQSNESIILRQKIRSVENISLIQDQNATFISIREMIRTHLSFKNQYVAQRARDAYLTSICQLEATFDLSHATQSIEFFNDDIIALNKRLK
jgi:hypothetical protein